MSGPLSNRWMRRLGVVALLLLYLGIRAAGARYARLTNTDLETFFLPSAKIVLAGHPLHIYEVRDGQYPNANGPLGIVPLTLVAALAEKLGIVGDRIGFRVLVAIVFSIFPLLLAREAVLAVELLRGARVTGVRRVLAYGIFALGPEGILSRGHLEQPLMLFLLLWSARSIMQGRAIRAGLLFGAALLTRSSTLLYLPPLVLLLVADRKWLGAVRFTASALLTASAGLLPFAIEDPANLAYSLFTSHKLLPSVGGSFWEVVPGSALSAIGHRHDSTVILAASVLFSLVLLARSASLRLGSRASYGLLAVCALCLPLLSKYVWAYYYVDAYILLAIFWLSDARPLGDRRTLYRWLAGAALPGSALLVGSLTGYVIRLHGRTWTPAWTLVNSAATVAAVALVAATLLRLGRDATVPMPASLRHIPT